MYFNMYLTMKQYEQIKYHPYFPFNFNTRIHDNEDVANYSEDIRETAREVVNLDNGIQRINENEREDFRCKLDDSDSRSSNDSREYIDNCNNERISVHNNNKHVQRDNRDVHERPSHNFSSSKSSVQGHTDFSIDRILSQDSSFKTGRHFNKFEDQYNEFDWLRCTRYKPPKIHSKYLLAKLL